MREEKLINRGWQFALLPCTPIDAKTAKKKELQRKQSGEDVRTELENLQFAEVDLPHDWAVSRPFNKVMEDGMSQGFRDRWGIGWYKKTLNIEEKKKGKRYLLYFGGVYENAVLWVNGMKIGSHKYGYSSFKMDITDAVQSGDNELLMRVDNSVSPADRWYSGCGIYRDVTLRIVPENHLDLCDEMGFYVYEECFDKWKGGLYGRYFDKNWESDVEAMVKRDRNRACIVIWGVGNEVENQGQDSMLAILKQLSDKVRSLDSSRPITYAMNPHFKRESNVDLSKIKDIQQFVDEVSDTEIYDAKERVSRIAKIAEIVDIISCNYQEQWYELIHEQIPDKLILGTEVYEYFCGHYDQMQNFTEQIPSSVPFKYEYCIGSFIWTGYDYLGESMGYPAKGWSGALIHTNNEYRPIAYILKSLWSKEPVVHFSVMDYSLFDEGVKEHWDSPIYADHWHFPQFRKTLIPYMIASNCDEVHLFLNGKQFFIPRPSECKNGIITGFLPWQPGTVTVVGYQNGKEACRHEVVTPGMAVALAFDQECDHKECVSTVNLGIPEKKQHLLLTVRAVDENGNSCFRESGKVHFAVEGAAKIVGVDNGDICSNEPYQEDSVHLYHGCASVMLELYCKPGRVSVHAFGDGLRQAQTIIEACEK